MKVKEKIVRQARIKKEYSQDYIANLLGISQPKYSRLEKGEISFDIDELSKLIDLLDLNPLEVLDFTEKQQVFINSNNTIVANQGDIHSPVISNDEVLIKKIVQEELKKLNL